MESEIIVRAVLLLIAIITAFCIALGNLALGKLGTYMLLICGIIYILLIDYNVNHKNKTRKKNSL